MAHTRTHQLTLLMTDVCNMNCSYCYPGDYKEGKANFDIDFARCGLSKFLTDGEYVCNKLRFYAVGEPTLEFELIKLLYCEAKNLNPNIKTELQTNGYWVDSNTLDFDNHKANWISNNIDMVWISYDGLPDLHDLHRKNLKGDATSHVVEKSIKKVIEGTADVGVRPTITPEALSLLRDIIDHTCSLGVKYIYFHHCIKPQGKNIRIDDDNLFEVDLMDFAEKYVESYNYAKGKGVFLGNFLTVNFDEQTNYFCRTCLGAPQLTLDYYVSACDKAPFGSDPKFSDLIIGHYDKKRREIQMYEDKLIKLRERTPENMTPCKNCSIRYNCAGGCLGESNFLFGDMYRVIPSVCEAVRYLAKHIPLNKSVYPITHP